MPSDLPSEKHYGDEEMGRLTGALAEYLEGEVLAVVFRRANGSVYVAGVLGTGVAQKIAEAVSQ